MTNDLPTLDAFIERWQSSGAAERANYQLFLSELCDLLDLPRPDPAGPDDRLNAYVFEKAVPLAHGTTGRIDLYKRGCFVLEAKQGSDQTSPPKGGTEGGPRKTGHGRRGSSTWDTAMEQAKNQAQSYARGLPAAELTEGRRPPFVLVVDVGHQIALYSEFLRSGGHYIPFPDPQSYRLSLADLRREETRALLRQIWLDPTGLDPSRRSARVTRDIATQLAELARQLEQHHPAEAVAGFLMRCLFTMFAEDVGLLPGRSFTQLLLDLQQDPASFRPMVEHLWQTMNSGGFSVILRTQIPHFNGGLFAQPEALALTAAQIERLSLAARADWREVEPAIFGTLLERALNPIERHQLGAHYTPRAYVERLVEPTVIAPLRAEWEAAQTAAALLDEQGQSAKAIAEIKAFHHRLAATKILDPACGTGNFLYVSLEHLKRLEGEVLNRLQDLGDTQLRLDLESVMVTPQQFLGIEVNPRAAAIAELVLWIGFLQWHYRSRGNVQPPEPIIKDFHNIECRDAVLAWDEVRPRLDAVGQPVTRWDGRTLKTHPVTGEKVPDETARVPLYDYLNPRPAEWPEAEFVVGNPPFIANRNIRAELGDGYADVLAVAYEDVKEAVDFVMLFWHKASKRILTKTVSRFGLITTNSIRMKQNQGVVIRAVNKGARIIFAIPDHPWPSEKSDAKVRISMTVVGNKETEHSSARLLLAPGHDEVATGRGEDLEITDFKILIRQEISPDLSPLVDISNLVELKCWSELCHAGMKPYAKNLIISKEQANTFFRDQNERNLHAPQYRNGQDIARQSRNIHVLDFYGYDEEQIKHQFPEAYQYLLDYVYPQRVKERNPKLREYWWLFEANRPNLRDANKDISRFIVTVENAPVRYFVFLNSKILPDQKLRVISSEDGYVLGVLSSRIHTVFSMRVGGRQGVANTPVYNTQCTTTFPFPAADEAQQARIRTLGEALDAHRKRQQAQHPQLTMTEMYNVLEKLRAGEPLSAKEKQIHEWGLLSLLRQLHDDLDAAVCAAYGWPVELNDAEILERLVALNAARAAEEAQGQVRWLRPGYQAPEAVAEPRQATLIELPVEAGERGSRGAGEKMAWPSSMAEQAQAVRAVLARGEGPLTAKAVAAAFSGAKAARVTELLETLVSLGQARQGEDGRFVG